MRLSFREALLAFRRSPLLSALGVMTIAFSLFSLGLFVLVAYNIRHVMDKIEERVEIRAYLKDDTPPDAVGEAVGTIGRFQEVSRVEPVSKEQALERARKEMGEFSDVFTDAFLPASINVRMKPGFRDPATVKAVADRIAGFDFVDDVRYGEEWVQKVYTLRNAATALGLTLGSAFGAVAMIIIGATIRITVLARAREISIMRLVGATDGFVRLPFLLEGFIKGVLGGLLALLLTYVANTLISEHVLPVEFFDRGIAIAGVVFGAFIGLFGSAVSVGRHLRRV